MRSQEKLSFPICAMSILTSTRNARTTRVLLVYVKTIWSSKHLQEREEIKVSFRRRRIVPLYPTRKRKPKISQFGQRTEYSGTTSERNADNNIGRLASNYNVWWSCVSEFTCTDGGDRKCCGAGIKGHFTFCITRGVQRARWQEILRAWYSRSVNKKWLIVNTFGRYIFPSPI